MDANFTQQILIPSLELIRSDTKIKRFYFLPWLLSVIFLSVLLVYQSVYTYVELLWNRDQLLQVLLDIFHSQYMTEILITSVIFILFYVIATPIFEGALIRYIKDSESGVASRSDAFWFWLVRFYAVFEYNNIFNMFKLTSILNAFLFSLRYLGVNYIEVLAIIFFIAFLFSLILNILIAYARYEIVLENKGVFEAISSSSRIALLNIKVTLRLYAFMFLMNIKVVINFFIFLVFPLLGVFIAWIITSQIFATIAFIILWGIFVFLLIILWYMAAVLDIFTTTIWYKAYTVGKKRVEALEK
jgi:hypothetical protein